MGEQRPMFRFRLPWMISSAPAPPPPVAAQRPQQAPLATPQPQTKIEPSMNPIMPVRRPFRLSSIAPAQPPPPIQPAVESQSERITITSTPRTLPQASPIWSPRVSAAQDPRPQAEIPPEIKSQTENSFLPASTSPSRSHSPPTQLPSSPPSPQLRATSQFPSPQLRATSHPPSPRHIPSQEQDTSQLPSPKSPKSGPHPSSPRPASSKASDASQTSSPSRTSSKVRDSSQPSSPDRTHFLKSSQPETFQQPRSPPQFQSSGQKSPITSSPSLTASNVQQTTPQSPPRAEPPSSTFQPQTNIEPNVNPTTPVQRPFRFAGTAPAQPPPPIQPTVQSQSQSKPITITSGPAFPPQAPPSWSPKISAAKDPLPQPEVSVDSKSQTQNSSKPISPSKTNSQATSQLPSPSLASAQSSATSQLPYRLSASPQPPSPWPALSQERETTRFPSSKSSPQPSSPWSESSKAKDSSQQSSPDRHQFQKPSQAETVQQPRSPSKLDFQPWKKTSPITSSPSLTPTNVQQTERTTRLPSPSIMSAHVKSLQPSASSDKPPSPLSVKPSVAVSQPQSQEDRSKTKFTPSVTFKSPTKGTAQPADNVAKPPKRDIEMVPNTSLVAQEEPKQRRMAVQFTETSELTSHNKEKLKIESQAEHNQLKNQHLVYGKEGEIPKASSLDEKQTKTKTSQQTDKKSTISESRKKLMKSNEDRVPFQEQLRNDIFMFANKMAFAHTENYKDEQLASVIALAGKNKGALMKLGSVSAKGEETHGANETEPVEGTKENERNGSAKRRSSNNKIDQENQIQKTFVNNNVQDINNSLLMNSSITERNPGVHLALYYDPTEPIMSYDRKGSSEARKGKSRSPIPKSFAYEPTI